MRSKNSYMYFLITGAYPNDNSVTRKLKLNCSVVVSKALLS